MLPIYYLPTTCLQVHTWFSAYILLSIRRKQHPHPQGEGGKPYTTYRTHIHRRDPHPQGGGATIQYLQHPHPQGGRENHDHGGGRGGGPNLEHIYIYILLRHLPTPNHQSPFTCLLSVTAKIPCFHASTCIFFVTVHQVTFFPRVFFIFRGLAASTFGKVVLRRDFGVRPGNNKNRNPESVMLIITYFYIYIYISILGVSNSEMSALILPALVGHDLQNVIRSIHA